jgi:hypothetical protein
MGGGCPRAAVWGRSQAVRRGDLAVTGRRCIGVGGVAGLQAFGEQDLKPGGDRNRHQRADQPERGP